MTPQCADNSPGPRLRAQLAHLFGLFKDEAGFIFPLLLSPALSATVPRTGQHNHHVSSCSTQKLGEDSDRNPDLSPQLSSSLYVPPSKPSY